MNFITASLCGMELNGIQELERDNWQRNHEREITPPMSQDEVRYYDEQLQGSDKARQTSPEPQKCPF